MVELTALSSRIVRANALNIKLLCFTWYLRGFEEVARSTIFIL